MSTIQDLVDVEKCEGRFHPTALGMTVNDVLIDGGFGDLFNETYTARMEEELDEVEEGKLKWTDALDEFYDKFSLDLEIFKKYAKERKDASIPTEEVCLKCGAAGMVQKSGRLGQSLKGLQGDATTEAGTKAAANGDPASAEDTAETAEPEVCELCGKPMQLKRGRFG